MWDCELHSKWVNDTLDRLIATPELSYDHAIALFNAWVGLVQAKIVKLEEFTASEFLLACIGYFIFYDLKDEKYCLPSAINERNHNNMYHRTLNFLDVVEVKERFKNISTDLIKKLSTHCDFNKKKSAFFFFELINGLQREGRFDRYIQRNRRMYIASKGKLRVIAGKTQDIGSMHLIPTEFIQYIFYANYGLDPKIVKDGLPMVNRCTAKDAAKKLGIEKHNLIKKCFDNGIGVYVNSSQYKLNHCSGSVHKEIIDAKADLTYLYPHSGLVRLFQSEIETLYKAPITTNGQQWRNVELQPSLTDLIQGYAWCIELRGVQQITIDDLWFIEDEILGHKPEEATRRASKSKTMRNVYQVNGKKSAKARKETAINEWERVKPALLNIAKSLRTEVTANKIAQTAVNHDIIQQSQLSGIAKKIRADSNFIPYLKSKAL